LLRCWWFYIFLCQQKSNFNSGCRLLIECPELGSIFEIRLLTLKKYTMHFRTFVNGVLVGILLGVLFAPDSGEETRKKISRRAQGIKDNYDDFADNVADTYNKVKRKAGNIVSKAKDINNEYEV
jgi:hypothetical protein